MCSVSIFVVDDCCLSRLGDRDLPFGGDDAGGRKTGISVGFDGRNERGGDTFVRLINCKN